MSHQPAEFKDHQIAKLVNDVRNVAVKYHDHQSLRERIAELIVPAIAIASVKREPLSEEQISELDLEGMKYVDIVRIVEKAHGIPRRLTQKEGADFKRVAEEYENRHGIKDVDKKCAPGYMPPITADEEGGNE